jgi:DNA helicase HerA-like ATPase
MHTAVYGQSGTGKSTLMKARARLWRRHGQPIDIFDGKGDAEWATLGDATSRAVTFERWLRDPKRRGRFTIVDEARNLFGQTRRAAAFQYCTELAMNGRHDGRAVWFATQYPTSLMIEARTNCERCYCFRLGSRDQAKLVCEDYSFPRDLMDELVELPNYHFFELHQGGRFELKKLPPLKKR